MSLRDRVAASVATMRERAVQAASEALVAESVGRGAELGVRDALRALFLEHGDVKLVVQVAGRLLSANGSVAVTAARAAGGAAVAQELEAVARVLAAAVEEHDREEDSQARAILAAEAMEAAALERVRAAESEERERLVS